MPRISQGIDGLLQGISEQPEGVRLPQHGRRQVNLYDKLGRGKITRPPTEHISLAPITATDDVFRHDFKSPDGEDMTVLFIDGMVRLNKRNGDAVVVQLPEGFQYLQTPQPSKDIRAITVGDVTYILNKSKTVALDSTAVSPQVTEEALVVVGQGAFSASYVISLTWSGGSTTVKYQTAAGTDPTLIEKNAITMGLVTEIGADAFIDSVFDVDFSAVAGVITFKTKDGSPFSIFVDDTIEGAGLTAIKGTVDSFDALPRDLSILSLTSKVRVKGSPETERDDYWVEYGTLPTGDRGWHECPAPGVLTQFNPNTFLWTLQIVDGDWTCQSLKATERKAGDDTTCPPPSFVGRKLTELFFHRGRLGVAAMGGYVVLSQASKSENFWRQSAALLLADDVIDVKAAGLASGDFHSALEWNGKMWLWSPTAQYVLSGEPVLSPATVSMDRMTAYENVATCRPVVSGSKVFFLQQNGDALVVNEYALPPNGSEKPVATNVVEHCPNYVKGDPIMAIADDSRGFFGVLCEDFSGFQTIYVYVYAIRGGERVQASWSEWTPPLGARVESMVMDNGSIWYLLNREDGGYIERQNLDFEAQMARFDPDALAASYLDRYVIDTDPNVAIEFDGAVTTWTLPYDHNDQVIIACIDDGTVLPVTYIDPNSVSTPGNQTRTSVVFGVPYQTTFEFHTLRFRNARTQEPRLDGRLMLQNVIFNHNGATITSEVTNGSRPTITRRTVFSRPTTNRHTAFAFGDTRDLTIVASSIGPGLCALTGIEWIGAFIPTTQRVG